VADERLAGGVMENFGRGRGPEALAESRGKHDDGEAVWRRHRLSLRDLSGGLDT
jgi:hypothetical protein